MAFVVTPRALEVLRRALELGRMDATQVGIRVSLASGGETRTAFAERPEPDETAVDVGGIRLFVARPLYEHGATIDVADEHDRIVVR